MRRVGALLVGLMLLLAAAVVGAGPGRAAAVRALRAGALAARPGPYRARRCRCRSRRCSCLPSHRRRASPRPLHLLHRSGPFRATPRRRPAGAPGASATPPPRRPAPPAGRRPPPRPTPAAATRRRAAPPSAAATPASGGSGARCASCARCLDTLPRLYRRVLVLRAGVGRQDVLTIAQTARRVDRRERAVRRIQRRGVRRLRAADRDGRCGAAAPHGAGATGTVQAGDELAVAGHDRGGVLGRLPGLRRAATAAPAPARPAAAPPRGTAAASRASSAPAAAAPRPASPAAWSRRRARASRRCS